MWDGAPLTVSRKTSGSYRAEHYRGTVNLMVQRDLLEGLLGGKQKRARALGTLARALLSEPTETEGTRTYHEPVSGLPAVDAFNDAIKKLMLIPLSAICNDAAAELRPPALFMGDDAKAAWVAYHDEIEGELLGRYQEVRDFGSKSAENAARLAALFWLLENGGTFTAKDDPALGRQRVVETMDVVAMERGIAVARWFLDEAARVVSGRIPNPEKRLAAELWTWLDKLGEPSITRHDIGRLGPYKLRHELSLRDRVLQILKEHGFICIKALAGGQRVHLNPLARENTSDQTQGKPAAHAAPYRSDVEKTS